MTRRGIMCMLVLLTGVVHAVDIDFESYTAGIAPPSPWTSDPGVTVTDSIAKNGSKSLAITYTSDDKATYPFAVEPGESASFSVWVRPSFTENNAQAASVGIIPGNTSRPRALQFQRNWHVSDGSTKYSVHWDQYGGTQSVQGDYISENWYLVNGEITPTEIILSTTTESGLLTYSFDRSGEAITAIALGYGNGYEYEPRIAHYDDLSIILPPPPATTNTLTVVSAHGAPSPAVGTTQLINGSATTCSVENGTAGLTNYSVTGWTLSNGQEPASGTTNSFELISTTNSTLTWTWQTNYWLDISTSGSGSVGLSDGFYAKGSEQILTATPEPGWLFMGWSGDASGTNGAAVTMDAPNAVTATFSDDADGDGLTNTEEASAGSNPWNSDTDGDGFDDAFEVAQGLNVTNDSAAVVNYIETHDSTFGLYPSNVVLDVATGQMLLETVGNNAALFLQLEESDDLVTWTNAGEAVEWIWPVSGDKKFFRVRSY